MKLLAVVLASLSSVAVAGKFERKEITPVRVCAVTINSPQSAKPTKELTVVHKGDVLVGKNITIIVGEDFLVGCGVLAPSVTGKNLPQKG